MVSAGGAEALVPMPTRTDGGRRKAVWDARVTEEALRRVSGGLMTLCKFFVQFLETFRQKFPLSFPGDWRAGERSGGVDCGRASAGQGGG